jgi:predicted protein tyrosine phosphatase
MQFSVLSRGEVEYLPNDVSVPHVIISITNPGTAPARVRMNDNTLQVLRLEFEDMEDNPNYRTAMYAKAFGEPKLFNRRQAQQIKQLVENVEPEMVVVHCEAGISRSAAVAAALSKHYNGDDRGIWVSTRYFPNKLVYNVLLDVLNNG